MRSIGKQIGHEIKEGYSSKGSVAGSQLGTNDTKMEDVEFIIPNMRKVV